jgi:hypothetical protein
MRRILMLGVAISILGASSFGQNKKSLPFPVPLNHFYIVLDSDTYKAIAESDFLRNQFAVSELRTTVRTDLSYKGIYFYGANTYFEFFDVSTGGFGPVGNGGIALGVDRAGGLEVLKSELASDFASGKMPITRPYDQKQVPWFFSAYPKNYSPSSPLKFWVMEYHPDFLSAWNPEPGNDRGMSRGRILARYAKVLNADPASRFLEDVVALEIAVDKATENRLGELCQALGYSLHKEPGATIVKGPDITLKLIPETELARGIREIAMRVRRMPEAGIVLNFGPKSALKFQNNGTAIWSFR